MCRRAHGYGYRTDWERPAARSDARTITTEGASRRSRDVAPAVPESELLVADRDREQVVQLLKRAATDGRLTIDEFGERAEEAYRARTGAELRAVLRQLPYEMPPLSAMPAAPPRPAGPARPPTADAYRGGRHPHRSAGLSPLVVVALVFAVVALATGGHVFAAWPLLWLLVVVGRRVGRRPEPWR